jgi:hydrogenase expression/formation protein HypC
MKVIRKDGETMVAEIDGVKRAASLLMLGEQVEVGDYVLIHAGFAISKLDKDEAQATLTLMRECLDRGTGEP